MMTGLDYSTSECHPGVIRNGIFYTINPFSSISKNDIVYSYFINVPESKIIFNLFNYNILHIF